MGRLNDLYLENQYDREEKRKPSKKQEEKGTLTTSQKIKFISENDWRYTKEELESMLPEEINLIYTQLNKRYWESVRSSIDYNSRQKQKQNRYVYDQKDNDLYEETDGFSL